MQFENIRYLNQINRWDNQKIIELTLDCEKLKQLDINLFISLNQKLFPDQSDSNALPEILLDLINFIKNSFEYIHQQSCFIQSKSIQNTSYIYLLIPYFEKAVAEKFFELMSKINNLEIAQFHNSLNDLKMIYEDIKPGPSTQNIISAAIAQNIPYIRLNDACLVQLGQGYKQHWIDAASVDLTPYASEEIAQDKNYTKIVLDSIGIPTPRGQIYHDLSNALYDFHQNNFPRVIKPLSGRQGKGVTVNIQDDETFRNAFWEAQKYDDEILIEEFIPGKDFRLLVVGDKLVAAALREPPFIIGNNQSSIEELISQENQNPLRGRNHNNILSEIVIDDILINHLIHLGLSLKYVPKTEEKIYLRQNANLSTGGIATDITDNVHPDIALKAVMSSKAIGLDICGIDLVCKDITQPLTFENGRIIELNMSPGLRMHISPSHGVGRNIGKDIIHLLYPNDDGRIPTFAITGTNGKTTTTNLITQLLEKLQHKVGMATTSGLWIGDQLIDEGDCAGPYSAETILRHPEVTAAVFEVARGGIIKRGLGFDEADVVIITNIGSADHLGIDHIHTPDDILTVKSTLLRSLKKDSTLILNIDDPLLQKLNQSKEYKTIYVSYENNSSHSLEKSNQCIFYDKETNQINIQNEGKTFSISLNKSSFTGNGTIKFQVMNLMFAIGALWAIKIEPEKINELIPITNYSKQKCLGRFNLFQNKKHPIIIDYAHNLDAVTELFNHINLNYPEYKKAIVMSSPGDRLNNVIKKQMEIIGNHVDRAIIFQDLCQRNRAHGEIPNLLKEFLGQSKRIESIHHIESEMEAIQFCLKEYSNDHLIIILIDDIKNNYSIIEEFLL